MTRANIDDPHHLASAPVVVGVDGSTAAASALTWAAEVALQRGRELRIVHGLDLDGMRKVFGRYDVWVPPVLESVRTQGAVLVERAQRRIELAAPGAPVSTEVTDESPAEILLRHSAAAYLVVLGEAGTNTLPAHLGSILSSVTSHAEGAVVVVRTDPDADDRLRTEGPVVVGVDGSPVSEAALAAAFDEASQRDTELVAVHAWTDMAFGQFAGDPYLLFPVNDIETDERAALAERLAGWQEKYPDVTVRRDVCLSDPATALQRWSASAQLVVVGSRGRAGFRSLLLGSTSNALVQHAHCPVMVVHPPK
ncbi:nucleotide-binding universal stress UspA family protein [Nocardia transvalensis]|uniref:Nucleotide-binding universal stress UspA family protein n=1 Tax=Nocardia transvalensis TaxID=37333 RepID=A0A7W9PJ74_9NOCA|nr:universal stress protein [Nocardia transvalensis]MBB5916708.1 nucleotide-binding universal stress UspA family protein [Nocardia transvalensis]